MFPVVFSIMCVFSMHGRCTLSLAGFLPPALADFIRYILTTFILLRWLLATLNNKEKFHDPVPLLSKNCSMPGSDILDLQFWPGALK
jgi:hypothetical protein